MMEKITAINDLYGLNDLHNSMEKTTEEIIKAIHKKREEVILGRLKELDIRIDLKEEERRVFKRLIRVIDGDKETILFNNGSVDGLRVVTFVTKQTPFDPEKFSIGYETTYY